MKHAFHPADQRGRFGQSHTRDGDSAPAWSTGIAAIDACLPGEGLNRCGLHEIEPLSPTDMPSLTGFGFALLSRFGSGLPIIWCVTAQQIGMMGRASQLIDQVVDRSFVVLPFVVDDRIPARITTLVDQINGDEPDLSGQEVNVREFTLDMNVSSNGMMGGMMGGMGINGRGFDMSRIDFNAGLGTIEKWIVSTDMLAHPFHIHGVSFQVLKENNGQPKSESVGWKDTVVVDGTSELLVKFGMPASEDNPFMYHCHILEHEDNGMMGQFTVS